MAKTIRSGLVKLSEKANLLTANTLLQLRNNNLISGEQDYLLVNGGSRNSSEWSYPYYCGFGCAPAVLSDYDVAIVSADCDSIVARSVSMLSDIEFINQSKTNDREGYAVNRRNPRLVAPQEIQSHLIPLINTKSEVGYKKTAELPAYGKNNEEILNPVYKFDGKYYALTKEAFLQDSDIEILNGIMVINGEPILNVMENTKGIIVSVEDDVQLFVSKYPILRAPMNIDVDVFADNMETSTLYGHMHKFITVSEQIDTSAKNIRRKQREYLEKIDGLIRNTYEFSEAVRLGATSFIYDIEKEYYEEFKKKRSWDIASQPLLTYEARKPLMDIVIIDGVLYNLQKKDIKMNIKVDSYIEEEPLPSIEHNGDFYSSLMECYTSRYQFFGGPPMISHSIYAEKTVGTELVVRKRTK